MTPVCFTCRQAPAGYPGSPYSAYCERCQPAPPPQRPPGTCGCARCGIAFHGVTAFDLHIAGEEAAVHLDPAAVPSLELRPDGGWGVVMTEAERARLAVMREARAGRSAQSA